MHLSYNTHPESLDIDLYNQDCLEAMKGISDHSIDLILCDLPYGTTKNSWDSTIPLQPMWEQYRRIIKPRGAIVLFAQCPFDKVLGASNLDWLKYEWIWVKEKGSDILNSHYKPMKNHENILVFSPGGTAHGAGDNAMVYHPQYRKGRPYHYDKCHAKGKNYDFRHSHDVSCTNDGNHYMPLTVINFKNDLGRKRIHSTQKPVALLRYLIRTYTSAGDVVLDNCMGSGSTCIAALQEHRHFIGMELDTDYYTKACQRIAEEMREPQLRLDD